MKKAFRILFVSFILALGLVACSPSTEKGAETGKEAKNTSASGEINVISREDGSGTRGAFTELTGIEKDKNDMTYDKAVIQNSTDGVMTTVSTDKNAIGYISLGSLNDTVKAVKVDGVEATIENIKSGSYKISRPFLLVYKEDKLDDISKDFLSYINSEEGQKIIDDEKYISVNDKKEAYKAKENLNGKITIAGSTSVTPLMEKLVEGYNELNPKVEIAIETTGSSAGIQSATEGSAQIGMSSRNLKDKEKDAVKSITIALDGIAVIVEKENKIEDIKMDTIRQIFTGEVRSWGEIK